VAKIADDMMPPDFVVKLFRKIAGPAGTATPIGFLPVAPSKGDLQYYSFKLDAKREMYVVQSCSMALSVCLFLLPVLIILDNLSIRHYFSNKLNVNPTLSFETG
jgi:hypothetical protein